MSCIAIMGSGETAPTMVSVHREVFAMTPPGPAVMLDTTFGFQLNADELVSRTRQYFAQSIGRDVSVATWRRADTASVEEEKSLAMLAQASWVFAGPGSPTYALRQWIGTPLPHALINVVRRGGTLLMGSAAAVTLGVSAIPVYEIYKAGAEPSWVDGLDVIGTLTGMRVVVIPHYDNAEGGTHDTRFCYLGEPRLAFLEKQLPDDVGILGVDEHTALILDVERQVATVAGNHTVTVRRRAASRQFSSGTELSFDELSALLRGEQAWGSGSAVATTSAAEPSTESVPTSLRDAADTARTRFDTAAKSYDADGCVGAILDLEAAIVSWESDSLQSSDRDEARRVLRSLVVRLGALAESGLRDPKKRLAPFVEALLDLRAKARSAGDYAASDEIRDQLVAAGVEVRDTAEGVEWNATAEHS
jgi:cyanophycinase-like exopeptidase